MASTIETSQKVNRRVFVGKPIWILPDKLPDFPAATTTTTTVFPLASSSRSSSNFSASTADSPRSFVPSVQLCAPFPPCNPLGCGSGKAPIDCDECDQISVALIIVGMCLLSILVVFANILVIVIIAQTAGLRRRHGYIKISLAVSDLLIGLFVIPAALFNLTTTLYLPHELPSSLVERTAQEMKDGVLSFFQTNSTASIIFGTILIISVTTSIYNLLLLSLDRFLAVAFPLQSKSGKYFSKQRLQICIAVVWILGVLLSSFPAFVPSQFSYGLDFTTFFYIQNFSYKGESNQGVGSIALFSLFVLGIPYIAIVILNLSTMVITVKKLKFRKRLDSRTYSKGQKSESEKRMKIIMETCPEMKYTGEGRFSSFWSKKRSMKNGYSGKRGARERLESVSSIFTRKRTATNSSRNLNSKVLRMITTMVAAFTVCICPYIVVNTMLVNGSLNCDNVGVPYNIAVYLVVLNSALNFFIYNLWHKEFRGRLCSTLTGKSFKQHHQRASLPNGKISLSSNGRMRSSSAHVITGSQCRATSSQSHNSQRFSSFPHTRSTADTQV